MSAAAPSLAAAGNSGGSGLVRSRWRMIATESLTTSPSSTITGTSPCPLIASTALRSEYSIRTDSASSSLAPSASAIRSQLVENGAL